MAVMIYSAVMQGFLEEGDIRKIMQGLFVLSLLSFLGFMLACSMALSIELNKPVNPGELEKPAIDAPVAPPVNAPAPEVPPLNAPVEG